MPYSTAQPAQLKYVHRLRESLKDAVAVRSRYADDGYAARKVVARRKKEPSP